MPFCPKCGYEYEKNIDACPDCEVELVEHLLEDHFDGELVDVFTSFSVAEAGMVKELLYNEGILSGISNEFGSAIFGQTSSDVGKVKVYVSGDDQEQASNIIETYIDGNPLEDSDDYLVCSQCGASVDEGEEVCPHCGAPFDG